MKIQINEVWNDTGKSVELATVETFKHPYLTVVEWVRANRPDLSLADGLFSHGYHAKQVA